MQSSILKHTNKKREVIRMQTEVTRLLGIEYPIIQGGMAWVAEYHLAAAVSNAGGLGLIGAASAPADWVRDQVRKAKELTDKPFGVNIMLMSPYADEVAEVIVEEGVKVVTTGAGNPEKYMKMWKEAGVKVIPVVASVALAKRMERSGADALVAEGCEAGGHIGENTTMVLVPQIVDAVNIPVIAAGGIADGRGIAAAFMLGAKGVQMGTHFVVTDESQVHDNYKERIIKARDIDSRVTGRTTGHPVRALRNEMTKKYLELENKGASFEELEHLALGGLRKAVVDGDVVNGSVMAGQIAGMVKERMSCKELVDKLVNETDAIIGGKGFYE
ncbi:enoyl-[acyl-carrier-protein] reductase FabK [Faecalicatena contorta]|uniref:enoyl-[acyl-carrier-protein] reductase FabK n=1 Tax=Faecalicatena contorta TaxID=39482 RepID=UPI0022867C92|nr:enoyl-[acyl-carrier-protein] reductase FabK [Faecalicatena contorta]